MANVKDIIKSGEDLIADLTRFQASVEAATHADYVAFDVPEPERRRRLKDYANRLLNRAAEARRTWLADAHACLAELCPKQAPEAPTDPKVRFERLISLYGMPEERRAEVYLAAVSHGDALTFAVVTEAPAYLNLLPTAVVERGQRQWAAKFTMHGCGTYVSLSGTAARVMEATASVDRQASELTAVVAA